MYRRWVAIVIALCTIATAVGAQDYRFGRVYNSRGQVIQYTKTSRYYRTISDKTGRTVSVERFYNGGKNAAGSKRR
jgi:hypothetical protein